MVHTSVEDEAIDADLFVTGDADSLYQALLVGYRRQCRHEPAVAIVALTYIVCCCALDEESWVVKDVLQKLAVDPTEDSQVRTSTLLTDCG
jgi:hypothetical protein